MSDEELLFYPTHESGLLIGVKMKADTLILRVDLDPFVRKKETAPHLWVAQLELFYPELHHCTLEELREGVGRYFWYEVETRGDRSVVHCSYRHGGHDEEPTLECQSVDETDSLPTEDELKLKCQWLADCYAAKDAELESLGTGLSDLERRIEKELDLSSRVIAFFKEKNPSRAKGWKAVAEAHRSTLDLVRRLMSKAE